MNVAYDEAYEGSPPSDVSVGDVGQALRRHWRWIAIPTLAAFVGSLLFVMLVAPRYTGEAKILLQATDTYFTRPGNSERVEQQAPQIDEQAVASQVQVVMSRDLAREAIRQLGLVGNAEFDPEVKGLGLLQWAAVMVGLAADPAKRAPEERVLERYYDNLLVYPVGKSRIVAIEFRSKDAELASRAANTIAELYLTFQETAKKDQARSATTWLGSNIDGLRTRVAEAEARVEAFRSRTGLLIGSGTTTLSAQQLSELSGQLAQAQTSRSDAQAKARLIRDTIKDSRTFDIPDVGNNELIRRLMEQRVNLRAQLALEQRTLLPQHPRIKELAAQLSDLEGQIRIAAERTVRMLENDAKIAGARVEAIEASIDQQKRVVASANGNEVELRALEREARIQREQLESYLGRYREAAARDVDFGVPPDARIVSRAIVPIVPSFPKKLPIVALSTIAALILAMGSIVARELLVARPVEGVSELRYMRPNMGPVATAAPFTFDFGFGDRSRVVDATPAEPAAVVAEPMAGEAPFATKTPLAAAVEPVDPRYDFGQLATRLARTEIVGRGRRILITGVEGREDVMRVSRGLALTVAGGSATILVEADADEESAVDASPGLTDLVAGEATFADVIGRDPGSRVHRVPTGTLMNEALTGAPEGLEIALKAFDGTYEWVICALYGSHDDALVALFAPRVDAVVIASNLEPASPVLVGAYESVQAAGGKDVVVAREQQEPMFDQAA